MDEIPGLKKLLKIAASGLGATIDVSFLWASSKARKEGDAEIIKAQKEGEAKIIAAETDAKVFDIQTKAHAKGRKNVVEDESVLSGKITLSDHVNERILYQGQKRSANIEAVMRKVALKVKDKEVPDIEPDHDWTARFFNDVQDVSSEEMQVLWAKVLAGEVEQPGSTSIRALGILKYLDRTTAQLFAKFCSACVFITPEEGRDMLDARVPALEGKAASNSLESFGFSFTALNRLNEHGLIISDYDSWYDYKWSILQATQEFQYPGLPFHHQGQQWRLIPDSDWVPIQECIVAGPALSLSGRELSKVVKQEPMLQYTERLQAFFLAQKLQMKRVKGPAPVSTKRQA